MLHKRERFCLFFNNTNSFEYNLDEEKKKKKKKKRKIMSEVGFEPTPTRVDCDLNAAP